MPQSILESVAVTKRETPAITSPLDADVDIDTAAFAPGDLTLQLYQPKYGKA